MYPPEEVQLAMLIANRFLTQLLLHLPRKYGCTTGDVGQNFVARRPNDHGN